MEPGPKPKPAAVRNLNGRSHHKQNKDEPKPEQLHGIPPAPRWLEKDARAEWKYLASQLYELGVITAVDLDALARYCVVWGRWREAERHVRKDGEVVKTPNGYLIRSPWLDIANKALGQLQSLGAEFGITPSTRTRVEVKEREDYELQDLADKLWGKPVSVTKKRSPKQP